MKILGSVLIVLGCFGIGKSYCRNLKGRYLDLKKLLECICLLKGEICYSNAPLREIFGQIHKKRGDAVSVFFQTAGKEMEKMEGKTFREIFTESLRVLEKQTFLNREDLDGLDNLGKTLGIMDVDMQRSQLELYTERLKASIEEAKEQWKEKERLVPKLGLTCGMVVVLILI